MNGDVIFVRCSLPHVAEAIDDVAVELPTEMSTPLPLPAFPSRDDIRRKGKRTLMLLEGGAWTAIAEGGNVADELLARALSRRLATECVVLGVYETANAWARRHYADGNVSEELFAPLDAFDPSIPESDSTVDASDSSARWLASIGWNYGFPLFGPLIQGRLPNGAPSTASTRRVIST